VFRDGGFVPAHVQDRRVSVIAHRSIDQREDSQQQDRDAQGPQLTPLVQAVGHLQHLSALNDADQHDDDRDDEQEVDEPSDRIGRHQAEHPQDQKHDRNGPEHCLSPFSARNHLREAGPWSTRLPAYRLEAPRERRSFLSESN